MKRIIERWHWGRLYTDDFSLLYASVRTQKKFAHHVSRPLMLARGGEIVLSTGEVELTEGPLVFHPDASREYPDVDPPPGRGHRRPDPRRTRSRARPRPARRRPRRTQQAGQAVVNKLLGHPGYFRFMSDFELNVVVDGEKFTEKGTTLHELVALR